MKRKYLLFILLGLFFIPFNAKAVNSTNYDIYDINYNVISAGNFIGQPGEWTQVSGTNSARIRAYYSSSFVQGCTYNVSVHLGFSTLSQYWYSGGNIYDIYINGQRGNHGTASASQVSEQLIGSNYQRSLIYTFDFTSPTTSSNAFFELQYSNYPLRTMYVMNQYMDINSVSCPGGGGGSNQDVINSINSQTTTIINNNNNNTEQIISAQEDTTDAINDLNDTLQETTIDDETIGDKIGLIEQISDTPITDLLTMPISLIQKIYNSMNSSCSSFTLGSLYNHTLTLPCLNIGSLVGSNVWSIIDGLFCLFMIYNIAMMVVHFFERITSLNDTFDDMYVPSHARGGGR